MDKYNFVEMRSSNYNVDPIFKNNDYQLFGNPIGRNTPELFYSNNYKYVLTEPKIIIDNEDLAFKIGAYLYHHGTFANDMHIVYFIGDINKCREISEEFSNQVPKLVSYEMIEDWFPKNLEQLSDKVINYFLKKINYFGQQINLNEYDLEYLLCTNSEKCEGHFEESKEYIIQYLQKTNRITITNQDMSGNIWCVVNLDYLINDSGENNKKCFIAIKFGDNESRIQSIQNSLIECGYEPVIMNEYETNNWIMPEIFQMIKECRFMIVDFTLPCDGAYYEAGYALALGKEVIHLCEETSKDKLHFDVAQKNTIMYKNFDDLSVKLKRRIKATIG